MNVQSKIPCASGLNPTDFKTVLFNPAPIRNKVNVKPILATEIKCRAKLLICGKYVLAIIAKIKNPIKYGIFIFPDLFLKIKVVINAIGIIHKERANFTVVAICNASGPNLLAAPTTELVS